MTPTRHDEITAAFQRICDYPADQQQWHLLLLDFADPELAREVLQLLEEDRHPLELKGQLIALRELRRKN